ncbi:TatD DNase family protein [Natronospira proteinivora]|uniref:TatD DNase family protein n=1 Tax=Natronospira proteinivora TaxID=1807133 RepID=A0ABT1G648_9GAMM|nr:TatD family hydrolase [Natronospira proteinivora]MCP1726769.1 TatD DNase family protein [Natronospira proteinivora]
MTALTRSPAPLIDIGANLSHDSFDDDRETVIQAADDANVTRMILTGASVKGSRQALALAEQWPGKFWSTVGVHPHMAKHYVEETTGLLRDFLASENCVAVGECGLDYFRNFSEPEDQHRAFRAQLEIACDIGYPVFLHQRDAHEDFLAILKEYLPDLPRAIIHCFTGEREELEHYLELDLYVGITGWICDERRGTHLRDIVGLIPDNRIMVETDAPYLLPRDLKPKPKTRRNEPKWLPHILARVAECRGVEPETLARQTTENAERFFALPSS